MSNKRLHTAILEYYVAEARIQYAYTHRRYFEPEINARQGYQLIDLRS